MLTTKQSAVLFVGSALLLGIILYCSGTNVVHLDNQQLPFIHIRARLDAANKKENSTSNSRVDGRVTTTEERPLEGAKVCAEGWNSAIPRAVMQPRCSTTNQRGEYSIDELYGGEYIISASLPTYCPSAYEPGREGDSRVVLIAGEDKSDVNIQLKFGGVLVNGLITDIGGGIVSGANVRSIFDDVNPGPVVETDSTGRFYIWTCPGDVGITAVANGYSDTYVRVVAPGTTTIVLTPESTISGTVIDAVTNDPVAEVPLDIFDKVHLGGDGAPVAVTDSLGRFNISGLRPGRYNVSARMPGFFGSSQPTTIVGLAESVAGIIVRLHRVARIKGRVVGPDGEGCEDPSMWLTRKGAKAYSLRAVAGDDGTVEITSALPGTYEVNVGCTGFVARGDYSDLEIADQDRRGLEWQVDAGWIVQGRVSDAYGDGVGGAVVTMLGVARCTTKRDGSYQLVGIPPGTHRLDVESIRGFSLRAEHLVNVSGKVTNFDILLYPAGSIAGVVVDVDGKAVTHAQIWIASANADASMAFKSPAISREDGRFSIEGLSPGDYYLTIVHNGHELHQRPIAGKAPTLTVVSGRIEKPRVEVERQPGRIHGTVRMSDGSVATGAYVLASREQDGGNVGLDISSWDDGAAVMTEMDGSFQISGLPLGLFSVRAFVKGGGEAVSRHVPVNGEARLWIKSTASIEGTIRGAFDEVWVDVTDTDTRLGRSEHFAFTKGAYSIPDLPAGTHALTAYANGGSSRIIVKVSAGERRINVDFDIAGDASAIGRIVDRDTALPMGRVRVASNLNDVPFAQGARNGVVYTDDDGTFRIDNVPRGTLTLEVSASNYATSLHLFTVRGVTNLGDVPISKTR
jgi:hypothetical protein